MHTNPHKGPTTAVDEFDLGLDEFRYLDEHVEVLGRQPMKQLGIGVDVYAVATRNLAAQRDPAGFWYVNHMVEQQVRQLVTDGVERPAVPLLGPKGRESLARTHAVLAEWWGTQSNRPTTGFSFDYMPRWREHVPSARALWPLQHPGESPLPFHDGAVPNADDWSVLTHVADAVGIRSRAAVVAAILQERFSMREGFSGLSLGSGAIVPVLKVAGALGASGVDCALDLWDTDPRTLAMSRQLAERHGLSAHLNGVRKNLLDPMVFHDTAPRFDMLDIVGFFEYLPAEKSQSGIPFPSASDFLSAAMSVVKPGGVVVLGNMLDTHPQLDFVMRCIQWPHIVPRGLEDLVAVFRRAGVADHQVTVYLPDDGVYAVATIEV